MLITTAEAKDKDRWNEFVSHSPGGSFLQSWEWGDVQRNSGLAIHRYVVEDNGTIVAAALVIERPLTFGKKWLYLSGGPVIKDERAWQVLEDKLIKIAQELRAVFIRIDPRVASATWLAASWRKALKEVQPRHTLVLDVRPSDEELLAAMHAKTRYNIRLAAKKGVTVRFSADPADIQSFIELSGDVQQRGSFHYHSPTYYRTLIETLGPSGHLLLAIGEYNQTVLAAHILIHWADTVTYAHGASSSKYREVMAPHLVQFESIRWARSHAAHWYDFYGVAPAFAKSTAGKASHPWAGITRFKEGFGGVRKEYVGAYDYVVDPLRYWVYNLVRKFKIKNF